MKRNLVLVFGAVVLLVGGAAAYVWFDGGSGEATTPTVAPELDAPASSEAATEGETAAASADTYVIASDRSTVSFAIDEELRGSAVTAVGSTSEVAGRFRIDAGDPSASEVGEIVVNAATFATDQSFRDRAIRSQILDTGTFELITFSPTEVSGLPAELPSDGSFSFTVTGDLTVRDVTAPATFALTAEPDGDGWRITGDATVTRSTYGLTIPSVPSVANVSDEITLSVDLVAVPEAA